MANKTARAGRWWIIRSGGGVGLQNFSMEVPDANVRLFRTNSNKITIIGELNAGNTGNRTELARNHSIQILDQLTSPGCCGR